MLLIHLTLKAFFVLEIFKFLFWLFDRWGKRIDKKPKLNFQIYGLTNCQANSYNKYIPVISRSKGSQTLIKYNIRNIFLGKSCTKCGRKTRHCSRSFSNKSKLSISLDQLSEVSCGLFLLNVPVEDCQNILKLRCWPLPFSSYKTCKAI